MYNEYYTLVGNDNEDHLRQVAEAVDSNITAIAAKSPGLDTTRKAVLTACNIMDDYIKLKEKYEALEKKTARLKKGTSL
ncbi:cell division protein ZapA [Jeotgalicoccus sp. WY2]|uniref:cell division protein ZapA n=1 Tax=Jeotgalicoccus sp. WY2 TaxID=2708346 RepID=UPI001BD48B2F